MSTGWRDWQLPNAGWICASVGVLVALIAGFMVEAGIYSGLLGLLVGYAVVGGLELWYRRRHAEPPGDA